MRKIAPKNLRLIPRAELFERLQRRVLDMDDTIGESRRIAPGASARDIFGHDDGRGEIRVHGDDDRALDSVRI